MRCTRAQLVEKLMEVARQREEHAELVASEAAGWKQATELHEEFEGYKRGFSLTQRKLVSELGGDPLKDDFEWCVKRIRELLATQR